MCYGFKKGTREMNALELADLIENEDTLWLEGRLSEIATMLRQQQAEIETLKAGKIRAYDNGVEDGRKPNTNLVKELTDEEITAISKEIFKDYKNFHHYQIDFARAVIKEVSGK